ncbi:MAG TPA: serine/threonine-protein kinase [Kofleriaceae bacterium]|nr:serine/threonine-protein kinase [Kofleriaceae bacterium]
MDAPTVIAPGTIRREHVMAVSETPLEAVREAGHTDHTDQTDPADQADPCRVADVTLAAAVRSQADAVYIEPTAKPDETYVITLERASRVLATVPLDAQLAAAVIARLAFLADIDLAATHAASGVLPVRSGMRETEIVITVRPGASLCADLMVAPRQRGRAQVIDPVGPTLGDVIGPYRVREFLGEGGMGTVFEVEHIALARRYALKVLRAKVIERDVGAAQKFLREARTAARVRHPNIVDVVDFGYLIDGRPYFVMELLEGQSLTDLIARGALPPGVVVMIARQLANALAAAHDRGVVHADVTPSNVLVVGARGAAAAGELAVKLVDFGLAELAGEGLRDENPEFVLGTPAYISPEQLRGLAPTDRSDQYGLGAVLFELLTGRPPFHHEDLRSLCMMHLTAPIPPIESPHGPLPPRLADIVTTCLQKTPQARFPGMRALLVALDEIERVTERRGWRRWLSS